MLTPMQIEKLIRNVPGFPVPSVVFKDITTVLTAPGALSDTVDLIERELAGIGFDAVASIESRGFVFGAVLAARQGLPLVLLRKPGKLPAETIGEDYSLEYGTARIEMHRDSVPAGSRIVVVDDLVATGGSALAACHILERDGSSVVATAFVINLEFLGGRKRLVEAGYPVKYIVNVETEG
jgi:adenine phosphoribosyltransferase